jgi:hypothetical protein
MAARKFLAEPPRKSSGRTGHSKYTDLIEDCRRSAGKWTLFGSEPYTLEGRRRLLARAQNVKLRHAPTMKIISRHVGDEIHVYVSIPVNGKKP